MPKISQIDEVPCQAEVRILQKLTLNILGVWKSGKPESGLGTGIGTGTGSRTGIGTGMGRETYIKTLTTFTLI